MRENYNTEVKQAISQGWSRVLPTGRMQLWPCKPLTRSTVGAPSELKKDIPDQMPERVLNSWKEIAHYVGRGVRTLQRWELDLSFPVRRPRSHQRSAVIAFPAEVDAWLKDTQTRQTTKIQLSPELYQRFSRNAKLLATKTQAFENRRESLQKQLNNTIALSTKLRAKRASKRSSLHYS